MLRKFFLLFFLFGYLNTDAQQIQWIPFDWAGDSVSGLYYDKLAINVPVEIDGIADQLYMQLDLGAATTVLYEKSFANYLSSHQNLADRIDTNLTFTIEGKINPMFRDVKLKLGSVVMGKHAIGLFQNYGIPIPKNAMGNNKSKHIGTLAPDIFKNKVLVINFPKQLIGVLSTVDELPKEDLVTIDFTPFEVSRNRIKIPMEIDGQIEQVLYDTGVSIFPLMTSKEQIAKLPNTILTDSMRVNSWGEKITYYGVHLGSPVILGNQSFLNVKAYYDERTIAADFFKREEIWGIVGNPLFLEKTLIIDYRNKRIGISQ